MADARISELVAASGFLATQEFPANDGGISHKVTGSQIQAAWGMDFLGSTFLASAAHETAVVTIAPRVQLWIAVHVASYGGSPDPTGDIASLRFNGDSGANYWSDHAQFIAGAWTDFPLASTNLIRMAGTNSRLSRNVWCQVNNLGNRGKTVNLKNQTGTGDPTVVGVINLGGGEWVNTTDQITSVQLVNQGSNNMGTNSGFIVFGKNL
ncbi:MAG TPA: hypothetical protein VK620_37230 [Bradyrhizobium sp.]|nr:hypothetical protein [Bradyrhizobium sp.]